MSFLADKQQIHAELMKLAHAGKITYYKDLGAAIGIPQQEPWRAKLDGISDDEKRKGKPDIADLLLNATTGWPSRISRQFTKGTPTPEQKRQHQSDLDAVFRHYCPGKPAPTLPLPKRRAQAAPPGIGYVPKPRAARSPDR
jgi:hypothetical protein